MLFFFSIAMTSSTNNSQTSLVLTCQTSPPRISVSTPIPLVTIMGTTPISSIYSHLAFSVSNIRNFVSEAITHNNYILWKELIIPFIRSKGVFGATISSKILQFIIQPGKSLTINRWVYTDESFRLV